MDDDKLKSEQPNSEEQGGKPAVKGGIYAKLKISRRGADWFVVISGLLLIGIIIVAVVTA